jgi:hypothetical protein
MPKQLHLSLKCQPIGTALPKIFKLNLIKLG